jgi:hypothetical protein
MGAAPRESHFDAFGQMVPARSRRQLVQLKIVCTLRELLARYWTRRELKIISLEREKPGVQVVSFLERTVAPTQP